MSFRYADVEPLIRRQLTAGHSGGGNIHTRGSERGGLLRVPLPASGSVVVKTWRVRSLKDQLKVLMGISDARHEWNMHRLLFRSGFDVPEPLGYRRLTLCHGDDYELMIAKDLGTTIKGMRHLKGLIASGDERAVHRFENLLIAETARLINLHVVDIDHQLNNFVVDERGRLLRIDFECARRYPMGIMPRKVYSQMLARFITGHIHAVQPDVDRSIRFVERLYSTVAVRGSERLRIRTLVDENLLRQQTRNGIVVKVSLPA